MNPMENGAAVRVKEKLINNLVPQYFSSAVAILCNKESNSC